MINWTAALPTFFVTLREGVEATLIVGIVFACLQQAQKEDLNPWVYFGVLAGVFTSVLCGGGLYWGLAGLDKSAGLYAPVLKQFLEMGLGVVAIIMLSWMLIWMTKQARFLKGEIQSSVGKALRETTQANWGIFSLVFVAVLREGLETAVFIAATLQEGWIAVFGAIAGLVMAVLLGTLLFKWSVRINLSLFFQVMGIILLLIISGMLISTLRHLDLGAIALEQISSLHLCISSESCLLGGHIWNFSQALPDKEFPGILLKTIFGYRQELYLAQAIGYILFWLTIGSLYFRSLGQAAK